MRVRFLWVFPLYLAVGASALYYASEGRVLVDRPLWRTPVEPTAPPPTGKQLGSLVVEVSGPVQVTFTHQSKERRIPWLRVESPDLRQRVSEGSANATTVTLASPTIVFYRFDEAAGRSVPMLRVQAERSWFPGIGREFRDLDFREPITLEDARIVFEPESPESPPLELEAARVTCRLAAPPQDARRSTLASLDRVEAFGSAERAVHVRTAGFEATSRNVHWRNVAGEGRPVHLVFGRDFEANLVPERTPESTRPPGRTVVRAPGGLTVTWQPPREGSGKPTPGLFDVPGAITLEQTVPQADGTEESLHVTGRDALVHFSAAGDGRGSARVHEVDVLHAVSVEGSFGRLEGSRAHLLLVDSEIERLTLDGPFSWRPSADVAFLDELFPAEPGSAPRAWESRADTRFTLARFGPPRFLRALSGLWPAWLPLWPPQAFRKGAASRLAFFFEPRRLLVWEGRPTFGSVGEEPLARADDRMLLVVEEVPETPGSAARVRPVVLRAEGRPVFEVPGLGRATADVLESRFAERPGGTTRFRLRGTPHVAMHATETLGALTLTCRDHLDLDQDDVGLQRAVVRGTVRMDASDPERGAQELRCEALDIVRTGVDETGRPRLDVRATGAVDFREPERGTILLGEALHLDPGGRVHVEGWPARIDMLVEDDQGSAHLVHVRAPFVIARPADRSLFAVSLPMPVEVVVPKGLLPRDERFQEFEGELVLRAHVLTTSPAANGELALQGLLGVHVLGPLDVRCQTLVLQPDQEPVAQFGSLGGSRVVFAGTFEGEPLRGSCGRMMLDSNDRIDLFVDPRLTGTGFFDVLPPGATPTREPTRPGDRRRVDLAASELLKLTRRWIELRGEAHVHQESLDPTRPSTLDLMGDVIGLERDEAERPVMLTVDGRASFRARDPSLDLEIAGTRIQLFVPGEKLEIHGSRARPADLRVRTSGGEQSWEGQQYIRLDLRRRLPDKVDPFR